MAQMTEKSAKVLEFVKAATKNITTADIAAELDIAKASVEGVVTGLQKKGLVQRIPAAVEIDGKPEIVKFVKATEAGMEFTPGVDDVEPVETTEA